VKAEPDKGFPTGGSAHTTAYDFFTQHPEGSFQLMNVLSDLGIPRDVRHIGGAGVHTYAFINANGQRTLFKWFWLPALGHRALVYDEATKLAGKNNNFQRVDLYNNIEAGNYPEWDLAVQVFADDGTYMYQGYDLLISTVIVPFEVNPPVRVGKLTLNRNPTNFFAEPESISFAPSNVVDGVSFVPDPLLQWRLMSYDDTATHRHNSPNGYLLPINRPIAPVNNNYRDGYMQPLIYVGNSISTPNDIGGVVEPGPDDTLVYTSSAGEQAGTGRIGRYAARYDWFGQARLFWGSLDVYAQQSMHIDLSSEMSQTPRWSRSTSTRFSTILTTVLLDASHSA
jgi:catalase